MDDIFDKRAKESGCIAQMHDLVITYSIFRRVFHSLLELSYHCILQWFKPN